MRIERAEFIGSYLSPDQFPADRLPEVALVGRSNVGKSSALNALVNQAGLAKVGKTPGKTQSLNFFRVTTTDPAVRQFYLVDLPGYGYAKVPQALRLQWGPVIERYLHSRNQVCGVVLFVDGRGVGDIEKDRAVLAWLGQIGHPIVMVATKIDKVTRGKRKALEAALRSALPLSRETPLYRFSARTQEGRLEVVQALRALMERKTEFR